MARKQSGHQKVSRSKVASDARRNTKTQSKTIVPSYRPSHKKAYNPARVTPPVSKHIKLPSGQTVFRPDLRGSSAERSLGALRYMRQSGLSFSEAAKVWHLDRRTFRKHAKSGLRNLKTGRIGALAGDRIHYTFQKPTTKAGIYQPVVTRSLKERQLLAK